MATNVEFDIRFDPTLCYDTNNGVWPWISVGTAGVNGSQNYWSQYQSYSHNNTGWFHQSIPIAANAAWTNIPNIFFQDRNGSWTGSNYVGFWLDNIIFTFKDVQQAPMRTSQAWLSPKPNPVCACSPETANTTAPMSPRWTRTSPGWRLLSGILFVYHLGL